ncbi:hypothetical protein [Helicobacter pylori]|uniref:hypothetical protein n=1 Tax=Helicobacter pylori TaxID=210 RepID=UPI0035932E77
MELKLCKIPTIGTQSENQTLPTGNISLGSPIVFSGWALHINYNNYFYNMHRFELNEKGYHNEWLFESKNPLFFSVGRFDFLDF